MTRQPGTRTIYGERTSQISLDRQAPIMTETALDLKGLKCPLPALKTRKALTRIAPGAVLTVTCTDPMAAIDIPNLIRETGDSLESQDRNDTTLVFRIRKKL